MKSIRKLTIPMLLLLAVAAILWFTPHGAYATEYTYDPEPTGNSTFDAFIRLPDYQAGAEWGYYQKPKLANSGSIGCCSYCADFVKYCYGKDYPSAGEKFYDPSEIRAGDIIHLSGHWFAVLKREGNMLYTAEGNWAYVVRIGWNYEIVDGDVIGSRHTFDVGYHYLPKNDGGTWKKTKDGWTFDFGNNFYAANMWVKYKGSWYFFRADGIMTTGWYIVAGKWYYFTPSGVMKTGWLKYEDKWYYMGTNGAMVNRWKQINGKWYFFAGGAMQTGWKKLNGTWYYFALSGSMWTGWKKYDGKWYFFDSEGAMVTGTVTIGSTEYTFDKNGALVE